MLCTKASLHDYSSFGNIQSDPEGKVDNIEVTVSVNVIQKKIRMDTSLILKDYKWKLDTPDELLDRILDFAVCIKKCEDKLRRTKQDLRTPVAKFSEGDDGLLEHLL